MSPQTKARIGAIVLIGFLLAIGDYFIHARHHAQGKIAYLASQAEQFDHMYSGNYQVGGSLAFALVMALLAIGVYELVAAGLLALLRRKGRANGGGA